MGGAQQLVYKEEGLICDGRDGSTRDYTLEENGMETGVKTTKTIDVAASTIKTLNPIFHSLKNLFLCI